MREEIPVGLVLELPQRENFSPRLESLGEKPPGVLYQVELGISDCQPRGLEKSEGQPPDGAQQPRAAAPTRVDGNLHLADSVQR